MPAFSQEESTNIVAFSLTVTDKHTNDKHKMSIPNSATRQGLES